MEEKAKSNEGKYQQIMDTLKNKHDEQTQALNDQIKVAQDEANHIRVSLNQAQAQTIATLNNEIQEAKRQLAVRTHVARANSPDCNLL